MVDIVCEGFEAVDDWDKMDCEDRKSSKGSSVLSLFFSTSTKT